VLRTRRPAIKAARRSVENDRMHLDPIVVQASISIPLALGFSLYSAARRDRSPLHALAGGLVFALALWMATLLVRRISGSDGIATLCMRLEHLTSLVIAPLFVVTMGYFARHPAFDQARAATLAFSSVFALFALAFLSDDQHGLVVADRAAALAGEHPSKWAGPLFWGAQLWILVADVLGLGLCAWASWHGRTPSERRRPLVVLGAILLPVLAHFAYVGEWLPIDFTLSPGAAGLAVLLFALGIPGHGLLESQPIVRQDLIEHMPDGLVLADAAGTVLDANAAAESILGRGRDALRGGRLETIFEALGAGSDGEQLAARIAGLPLVGARLAGELRTADARTIEVTAGALGSVGSQPAGRFVSLEDRTLQRRNERLLRERQKLESVGILAAGVAHEINNPLAFVRANLVHLRTLAERAEKLVDLEPAGADADLLELGAVVEESLEGVVRIARIVNDMLRFSRAPEEATEPVDVNDVIRAALRLAAFDRSNVVVVEQRLADGLPAVRGSPNRLVQVLLNLLLNANQALAGRTDARVVAESAREGRSVVVQVRDNGPGVPEEHRHRVFDPFFTTRPPGEGTGLGLSIAFDIVREHAGELEIGAAPEGGACFTIRLPAA
jgi:signal transduction histidine kinase